MSSALHGRPGPQRGPFVALPQRGPFVALVCELPLGGEARSAGVPT
jgi:hypothetical protein